MLTTTVDIKTAWKMAAATMVAESKVWLTAQRVYATIHLLCDRSHDLRMLWKFL